MKLEPSAPVIELAAPPSLLFLAIKVFTLGWQAGNFWIVLASLVFLAVSVMVVIWINNNFRHLEINDTIKIKGYFWGQEELTPDNIVGYKLRPVDRARKGGQDFNLFFVDRHEIASPNITQGDYKPDKWDAFVSKLDELGVQFIGQDESVQLTPWQSLRRRYLG
ncbi:MAG: hypothetical protein ABJA70_21965 [Chryseolinea sp.]